LGALWYVANGVSTKWVDYARLIGAAAYLCSKGPAYFAVGHASFTLRKIAHQRITAVLTTFDAGLLNRYTTLFEPRTRLRRFRSRLGAPPVCYHEAGKAPPYVAWWLSVCPTELTQAIGELQRVVAASSARYLSGSTAGRTNAIEYPPRSFTFSVSARYLSGPAAGSAQSIDEILSWVTAAVARRLSIAAAIVAKAFYDPEGRLAGLDAPTWAAFVARDFSSVAAMPTYAVSCFQPLVATAIAGRLELCTADVTQTVPQVKTRIATPIAG